jgi:DNA-binding CsgD family transcriptional regulator
MTYMLAGELDPAIEAAERALLIARAQGHVVAEVAALAVLCSVLGLRGELGPALDCGRAAASRADNSGVVEAHWNMPYLFLATALLWADQIEECWDALERADAIGRRLALGWHEPIHLATLADLHYRLGDWNAAISTIESGLCRSLDRGSGLADVWLHSVLARIHLHRGRLELAMEATDRAEHAAGAGGTGSERVATMRALCAEADGDLDAAASTVRALWELLHQRGIGVKLLEVSCDAARIARRADDRAFAATVVESTRQLARRCPDTAAPALLVRCRGLVEGDPELLARAATMLRLRRRPLEQAFAEWEAGSEFAARGDAERAACFYAAARELLDPIEARPMTTDAPVGERPELSDVRFGWGALTQSERNVVELVAAGLSNAEIAERLICSRRTVESHLHHVYTKVGMSSRVSLAVEARHRLAT